MATGFCENARGAIVRAANVAIRGRLFIEDGCINIMICAMLGYLVGHKTAWVLGVCRRTSSADIEPPGSAIPATAHLLARRRVRQEGAEFVVTKVQIASCPEDHRALPLKTRGDSAMTSFFYLCLSVFICVYLWLKFFVFSSLIRFYLWLNLL